MTSFLAKIKGLFKFVNPGIDDYYNAGVYYFKLDKFEKAIDCFEKAITKNPGFALSYYNIGIIKYTLGDDVNLKSAVEYYERAIIADPFFADAYHNMADTKYKLKQYKEAITDYEFALRLNPKDISGYTNMGVCKCMLKGKDNLNSAIEDYNTVIKLNPNSAVGYMNRGLVYKNLMEYEKSTKDYKKALELDSNFSEAYNNYADLLLALAQEEKDIKKIKLLLKDAFYNIKKSLSLKYYPDNQETSRQIKSFAEKMKIDLDSL